MKPTLVCANCKETFRREEMVKYATANSKTAYWYCPKCLKIKQENEWFINEICKIFGVKAPGSRIYKERNALKEKYGYTDKTIIDCLNYVYNVEHMKQSSVTLYLVNPSMIEKMMKYKRNQENIGSSIALAMQTNYTEYVVPIKEKKKEEKIFDFDSFFND